MNIRHVCKWCVLGALVALGTSVGLNRAVSAPPETPAPPSPATAEQGVQVLTRGPVHEAFAETVTFDPEPGVVVPKAPPAAIEEFPPGSDRQGPTSRGFPAIGAGTTIGTIFCGSAAFGATCRPAASGCPATGASPGKASSGLPGTGPMPRRARWTYLPEPPASVESGPNVAARSADNTWLPGCWIWQQNRYAWRPGFWAAAQPDWTWVPAHYVWAPRGYVYVDGYWDYSLNRRGVLFAPVYFEGGIRLQRDFSYSPTTAIDLGLLVSHLFVRPQYQDYYFGDYYAADYQTAGFYPCVFV